MLWWGEGAPSRIPGFRLASAIVALLLPVPAGAEIVRLTNGRSITVESARIEGRSVVLLMPGGQEIRIARELLQDSAFGEAQEARRASLDRSAIRRLVDEVAERVGLDRKLAHAVVHTESNYQPLAISPRGAVGLMQIMPALVRHYGLEDPFDPAHNLEAGMRHLRKLLQRFDIRRALAAYNAGEAAVARYGGVPPYRETEDYVRRILAAIR